MQRYINQYNTKVSEFNEARKKLEQLREEYNEMVSRMAEETNSMYQTRYSGGNTQ